MIHGWLNIEYPDHRKDRIAISRIPFHIGRYNSNHLVISEPYVSRFHMAIVQEDDQLWVKDLSSKSGTWINGRQVERAPLNNADVIQFHPDIDLVMEYHRETTASIRVTGSIGRAEAQFQAVNWLIRNIRSLQGKTVLREISQTLLSAAIELIDADYGMVMVPIEETWAISALAGPEGDLDIDQPFVYSTSIVQEVQSTAQPVLTEWKPDLSETDPSASIIDLQIYNILCVPLLEPQSVTTNGQTQLNLKKRVVGLLYLDRRRPGTRFQKSDLKVLSMLADEASRSMMFARLYEQVSRQERIQQEMDWARRVQARFLPQVPLSVPFANVIAFTRSSREVGGDYFFYTSLDADRILFAVGDISGKGLHAALLMALCSGAIHSMSHAGITLSTLVDALDELLRNYSDPTQYSTLFIGILDQKGNLEYINAGHPPALILKPSGPSGSLESFVPVIGILETTHPTRFIQLDPGDTLILYTDGIYDRIVGGEAWSVDSWLQWACEHLPPDVEAATRTIQAAIESWEKEDYLPDDITFLALTRKR